MRYYAVAEIDVTDSAARGRCIAIVTQRSRVETHPPRLYHHRYTAFAL